MGTQNNRVSSSHDAYQHLKREHLENSCRSASKYAIYNDNYTSDVIAKLLFPPDEVAEAIARLRSEESD